MIHHPSIPFQHLSSPILPPPFHIRRRRHARRPKRAMGVSSVSRRLSSPPQLIGSVILFARARSHSKKTMSAKTKWAAQRRRAQHSAAQHSTALRQGQARAPCWHRRLADALMTGWLAGWLAGREWHGHASDAPDDRVCQPRRRHARCEAHPLPLPLLL